VYVPDHGEVAGWRREARPDGDWYVSDEVTLAHDVEATLADWPAPAPTPQATTYVFEARAGFAEHLDNHETGAHYAAQALRRPEQPAAPWPQPTQPQPTQPALTQPALTGNLRSLK
jgi:hypothetical protein